MTMTDSELQDALAPLAERRPNDTEVAAILISARSQTTVSTGRRVWRIAPAAAVVVGVIALASTALPGADRHDRSTGDLTGVALLQTAAAVAADQPPPAKLNGYRYTEMIEHWRWEPWVVDGEQSSGPEEVEQRVETWVDSNWRGRYVAHQGRVIEGSARTHENFFVEPSTEPYTYGDGPRPDVERLPSEPRELREELLRLYRSVNWAPGHPTKEQEHYDLAYQVLSLLDSANTTPDQRAALWGVLALMPGVRTAPPVEDPLDRDGAAVTIPGRPDGGGGVFTINFDPRNSELLSWSLTGAGGGTPDQTHTILRAGHVDAIGVRPAR